MKIKSLFKKLLIGALIVIAALFVITWFSDDDEDYDQAYEEHYGYSKDSDDSDYYEDDDEYYDDEDEEYYDEEDEQPLFASLTEKYNYLKELFALDDESLEEDEEDLSFFDNSGNENKKSSFESVNVPEKNPETIPEKEKTVNQTSEELADWTVLVYMCGSDLESNYSECIYDIKEMLESKRGSNVNVLLQTGGAKKWHGFNISAKNNERLILTSSTAKKVKSEASKSMGEASTLSDFIIWAKENYPAKRYILDFWNHGGGSVFGVCFDEIHSDPNDPENSDSLYCSEIKEALSKADLNFELFLFDCCLSSTIEIADSLQNFGKYMVASEEFLIGGMMNYDKWLTTISQTPDIPSSELACQIAKYYSSNMKKGQNKDSSTIAVVDLSKIDMVKLSFQAMASQMTQKTQNVTSFKNLVEGVSRGVKYGSNSETEGYTNLIDLGEFAQSAAKEVPLQAEAVISAIKNAVIYESHGKNEGNSSGIAVYYPLHSTGDTEIYADNVDNRPYLQYLDTILDAWDAPSWVYQDRRVRSFTPVKSKSYKLEFETFIMNPESECNYALKITNGLDSVKKVSMCLFWYDEEAKEYLYLGSDDDVNADWKKGVFYDNFDASWFSIGDSYINANLISQAGSINTYSVPIQLNKKETNLRFTYDKEKDSYEILGAFDGTSGGASAKGMRKFKKGDKIDFIFDAISDDEDDDSEYSYICGQCTWEDGLTVERSELLDGLYYYQFEIEDIFGNVKESDFTEMEYTDGEIYLNTEEE